MRGADVAWTLIGVGSTAFKRAELHESMANGMRSLPRVIVPAGAAVSFAPAGRHVMLYEFDPSVKPGTTVPLQLIFESEKSVTVQAKVVGPADPAP
jgi:copper(I)-binding protein